MLFSSNIMKSTLLIHVVSEVIVIVSETASIFTIRMLLNEKEFKQTNNELEEELIDATNLDDSRESVVEL